MNGISILVADDHAIVRMGISSLLSMERDLALVGEATNGKDAVAEAMRLRPDVVVMDLMMPKMDGVEATAELHAKLPEAKVLLITTYGTSDGIAHALDSGASGAILKSAADTELIPAIRKIASGGTYVSAEIKRQLKSDPPIPDLTPRQLEILESMIRGLTNRDIARELGIRQDGVNEHVNAILQKIGAANRTEAVAIALRKHLLKI